VETAIPATRPSEADEAARVAALHRLGILDTPAEAVLDALVRSAAAACGTPMAAMTLIDRDRQWIKARAGLEGYDEIPRAEALCTTVLATREYVEIPDTRLDPRTVSKSCVRAAPPLVFYAGAPLTTAEGYVVGTLCVLDVVPRAGLEPGQRAALQELAHATMQVLLLRQAAVTAHRQLEASNEFLASAEQIAGVGGWRMDLETREVLWTAETRRIHDLPPDYRPTGDEHQRYFSAQAQETIRNTAEHSIATGEPWDVQLPMTTAQGRPIWVRSIGHVEFRAGRPAAIVGALQDITEGRQARMALEQSQERLHRALEGSGLALWDLDVHTEIIYLSATWSAMRGGEPHETHVPAQELLQMVPMEDLPRIQAALENVLDGRSPHYAVEHRVRRLDGSLLWIHSEGRVAERDAYGVPLRMVGTNRDISQHKQAEQDLREARDARRPGEPGQEPVPGHHEPRDPHAAERDHRRDPAAAGRDAHARGATPRRPDRPQRAFAAGAGQRHPRLLQDRGRPDGDRERGLRPVRAGGGPRDAVPAARDREEPAVSRAHGSGRAAVRAG
jgi:PAS domain S-box-containing protein